MAKQCISEQLTDAQKAAGVELDPRLVVTLQGHVKRRPRAVEQLKSIVERVAQMPEWLRDRITVATFSDGRGSVSEAVIALADGTGRWMLVDLTTGMLSMELWPNVGEAWEAGEKGAVSWSEPVYAKSELSTCIGCGCDDEHACWDEEAGNPCSWLRVDRKSNRGVCSVCKEHVARWDKGDREIAVPHERA